MGPLTIQPPIIKNRKARLQTGAWLRPLQTPLPRSARAAVQRRGTLGARQPPAMILGLNSGSRSQLLLGLFASLNQSVCWGPTSVSNMQACFGLRLSREGKQGGGGGGTSALQCCLPARECGP